MTIPPQARSIVVTGHLKTLQQRYDAICARAEAEARRTSPDVGLVYVLERDRARLSEELARYEGLIRTVTRGVAEVFPKRHSSPDVARAS